MNNSEIQELESFRRETAHWLARNCPEGARGPGPGFSGSSKVRQTPDNELWLDRMVERGWTVPTWPTTYGGAGLSKQQARILQEEMAAIGARQPVRGMGVAMIGPTLLELGTESQKRRHLPAIAQGKCQWCQGYSEPNAGSDLAALTTRAVDAGDHFVLNGQKTWTSDAIDADWMFALVRTNFDVPKHEGISFVLLPMDQSGITLKPIRLISGKSPFCETFFNDAIVSKDDLVGELNNGWSIGKRLLQFERSGIAGLSEGLGKNPDSRKTGKTRLPGLAKQYSGERDGRISDAHLRQQVVSLQMRKAAMRLTSQRAKEENKSGVPGAATSIFKLIGAAEQQDESELIRTLMGTQGLGADTDAFTFGEQRATQKWLADRAVTIYGGSSEIQANIIAKRVLGLPE